MEAAQGARVGEEVALPRAIGEDAAEWQPLVIKSPAAATPYIIALVLVSILERHTTVHGVL